MPLPPDFHISAPGAYGSESSTLFNALFQAIFGGDGSINGNNNIKYEFKRGQDGDYDESITVNRENVIISVTGGTFVSEQTGGVGDYSTATMDSGLVISPGALGAGTAYFVQIQHMLKTSVYYVKATMYDADNTSNQLAASSIAVFQYDASADVTRPTISNVVVTSTSTGATITWAVTENCTNEVYLIENNTTYPATSGTTPQVSLTLPVGLYNYILRSTDAAGNMQSSTGNFNVTASAVQGSTLWAIMFKPSFGRYDANAMTCDSTGNTYVTGMWVGRITLPTGQPEFSVLEGYQNGLLIKVDPNGVVQWGKRIGHNGYQTINITAVKTDSDDNVLIAGSFQYSVDFGDGTYLTNPVDPRSLTMFVAKYAPGSYGVPGALIWVKPFYGDQSCLIGLISGNPLAIDSSDNIYICGSSNSNSIDCGNSITVTGSGLVNNILLIKLDSNGNTLWAKYPSGSNDNYAGGLALDSAGNLHVVGRFGPFDTLSYAAVTTNLGGSTISGIGGRDAFYAKYNGSTGAHIFSRAYGTAHYDQLRDVAVGSFGVVVVGDFTWYNGDDVQHAVNFGNGSELFQGGALVAASYDLSGNTRFTRYYGLNQGIIGNLYSVDTFSSDFVISGKAGPLILGIVNGREVILYQNTNSGFFLVVDSSGAFKWYLSINGVSIVQQAKYSVDGQHIFACGTFGGAIGFSNGISLDSPNISSSFLAKIKA